jgi:hypothetical protein
MRFARQHRARADAYRLNATGTTACKPRTILPLPGQQQFLTYHPNCPAASSDLETGRQLPNHGTFPSAVRSTSIHPVCSKPLMLGTRASRLMIKLKLGYPMMLLARFKTVNQRRERLPQFPQA